ncbi:hypothetical protein HY17_10640 [Hyphomonas sp. CY54-11-8]|nr:hypothetical protein HY17_10640 [Hyphomonas sp. CY54-11-8]
MLVAARKAGAAESLLDKLKDVWLEDGMSHEKANRLKEWALSNGHAPVHVQAASLAFFILANNPAESWAAMVDRTIHIHGKFYGVDDTGVEEAIDYETILPLFRDGGFNGTIVSEWEGHAYDTRDAFQQVRRHQAMCKRILTL